jgi:N-acetylglucosamine-1-phosphate uridyltransferase (contains nucleotidyltransferase and I-patch acetyltransferase domains)
VQQALPLLDPSAPTLVLYGDVPLTRAGTLQALTDARAGRLRRAHRHARDPSGYGRIVRDQHGKVSRIVEQKDATPEQLKIAEINTGIIVAPTERLAAGSRVEERQRARRVLPDRRGRDGDRGGTRSRHHPA